MDDLHGPYRALSEQRIKRIGELTKQGLSSDVIGERLGMTRGNVYAIQIKHGFREVKFPRKERRKIK